MEIQGGVAGECQAVQRHQEAADDCLALSWEARKVSGAAFVNAPHTAGQHPAHCTMPCAPAGN